MSQAVAVIVAAGSSARMGAARSKQFEALGGTTVLALSVRAFASCQGVSGVVVVVPQGAIGTERVEGIRALPGVIGVVPGGPTRMASVLAGVEATPEAEIVLVHDAARPFVTTALVDAVLDASRAYGAAIPAIAAQDTVKRADDAGFVLETLERSTLRLAQTPQGARRAWLLDALRAAQADGVEVTDEAQALERAGRKIALVPGDPGNMKITTPGDLDAARRRAAGGDDLRVGHGYDVHRFDGNRPLVLGGVVFEGERGLSGHSDADVVLHAAMDAVLGAAGLPDIGRHFPPGDPRFAGADSAQLAGDVARLVEEQGWRIVNLDLTLIAEQPKISTRVSAMRAAVAAAFGIETGCVGVKATTHEGLGALGRREGIGCHAVALVRR